MQKVVHLSSAHPAFDTRIFIKQCRSLAKAEYDVTLIVPHTKDEECDGVKMRHIVSPKRGRFRRMLLTTWQVFKKARKEKAVLYHFHDPELIPIGVLLALSGAKVIYDVHEDVPRQLQAKHYLPTLIKLPMAGLVAMVEWIGSRLFFTGIIAATPDIAKRFPERKTCLIQNYVDLEEFSAMKTRKSSNGLNRNILYLGALCNTRGLYEMIDAMTLVNTQNTTLTLAGRFSSEHLSGDIQTRKGWARSEYIGLLNRDGIHQALNKADCGLVTLLPTPAYLRSYPVKMFEYMAAGLPLIISDFPLWRQILKGYDCALFVDPTKPDMIAKAVDWLFAHPKEAREMGLAGQKAVQEKFNWSRENEKLLHFYEKLIG